MYSLDSQVLYQTKVSQTVDKSITDKSVAVRCDVLEFLVELCQYFETTILYLCYLSLATFY